MEMRNVFLIGASALALALAACDAGPAAVTKSPQASAGASSPSASSPQGGGMQVATLTTGSGAAAADPRDVTPPLASDGKPLWAPNRKHTAEENAAYQFGKNGKDFGAASEAAYVAKVHAFVDRPPAGVKKIERSNGDALLYDAKTNTFAVVAKTGAPRTMFKPRDGSSYWDKQVQSEADRAKGGGNSDG
jgi:pyocin large subunit-like protein